MNYLLANCFIYHYCIIIYEALCLLGSTDKRSVTLLTTYNTRSVHAVTHRAQQNLRHFTAIRPCFQQFAVDNMGCVPFTAIASNLLAFSRKMADVAATSTDKRSVTFLTTYNTRSVHAVTRRAQQNLRDFTAIRPCFQQFAVDNMDDNVSRSNITTTSNNLLAIASARNACCVGFQQIASKLLQTEQSHGRQRIAQQHHNNFKTIC